MVGGHPLTVVLGDLATAPGVRRMRLGRLTVAGVARLIEAAGSPLEAEQVHSSTGGNAFYVTEVLATGEQSLPATVRDAVLARASRLSPAARLVLAAAAVLGQRAELELLTAVSGQQAAAVDECVERGMLVGSGRAWRSGTSWPGWPSSRPCRRRHAPACTGRPSGPYRPPTAAMTDGWPTMPPARGLRLRPAARAAGRRAGRPARRAPGGGRAVPAGAPARRLRRGGHPGAAARGLSYECYLTDQLPEAFTTRRAAMELYEQAGNTLAVGAAQRWLSRMSWFLGRNAESRRYAELAVATLEPLGDGLELAMAYSNRSQLEMLCGDPDGAVSWGNRRRRHGSPDR